MIIDCHGHYTTAPAAHQRFRDAQLAGLKDPRAAAGHTGRHLRRRDPREHREEPAAPAAASAARTSPCSHRAPRPWPITSATRRSRAPGRALNNDLIKRVVDLYPENFVGVCQLPQSPGVPIAHSVAELERCVRELGFIGCNLNPDPSGGHWTSPPLTDRHWYPFYEKMVELDVPAMVHVSASCNPNFHATGAHYINADTTAFMQFIEGDLFARFPDAALHHPARRRRRALPLGPLPRAGRHAEAAAAGRARDAQRVLRHLRLSPAGHRPAGARSSTSTTSCSARRWSARCAASTRRPAITSTTPSATSTRCHARRRQGAQIFEVQRPAGVSRGSTRC